MKWIIVSICVLLTSSTFCQSKIDSEQELIEYVSGVWNMDSLYGGWTGLNYIPSPYFADSAYVYFQFLESDVPETPLLFRYYFNGELQEETAVEITYEEEATFAGHWFLDVNAYYFGLSLIVDETQYVPDSPNDNISLIEYAFDANSYFLSKCFPEFDELGNPIFTDDNCHGDSDTSSVEENNKLHFEIFPNPTFNHIFLNTNSEEEFQVTMFSIQGSPLCTFDSPNKINMSQFPAGCYILKYAFKDGEAGALNIIKN